MGGGMIGLAKCHVCNGAGVFIEDVHKCKNCFGKGVINEPKILDVTIDKGTPHNAKYTFGGEGSEQPGKSAGDVIVVCKIKPHDRFVRKGADIFM